MIHFKLIFVKGERFVSSFIVFSLFLCQRSVNYINMGLFLSSLFYYIDCAYLFFLCAYYFSKPHCLDYNKSQNQVVSILYRCSTANLY